MAPSNLDGSRVDVNPDMSQLRNNTTPLKTTLVFSQS